MKKILLYIFLFASLFSFSQSKFRGTAFYNAKLTIRQHRGFSDCGGEGGYKYIALRGSGEKVFHDGGSFQIVNNSRSYTHRFSKTSNFSYAQVNAESTPKKAFWCGKTRFHNDRRLNINNSYCFNGSTTVTHQHGGDTSIDLDIKPVVEINYNPRYDRDKFLHAEDFLTITLDNDLHDADYIWQYRKSGTSHWNEIPHSLGGRKTNRTHELKVKGAEFIPLSELGNIFEFRVTTRCGVSSNVIPLQYLRKSPSVRRIEREGTTCFDSTDGGAVIISYRRDVYPGESINYAISQKFGADYKVVRNVNNVTKFGPNNTFRITGLNPGSYQLEVISENYFTGFGAQGPIKFTIGRPRPIEYTQEPTIDNVICNGNKQGSVRLRLKGGLSDEYQFLLLNEKNEELRGGWSNFDEKRVAIKDHTQYIEERTEYINTAERSFFEWIWEFESDPYAGDCNAIIGYYPGYGDIWGIDPDCEARKRQFLKDNPDQDVFVEEQVQSMLDYIIYELPEALFINNLSPGKYKLKVRDSKECVAKVLNGSTPTVALPDLVKEFSISEPDPISITYTNDEEDRPSGKGFNDGEMTATIMGGTPFDNNTYTIEWRDINGQLISFEKTSNTNASRYQIKATNLTAGKYFLTVKDKNYDELVSPHNSGCSIINSENTLKDPDPITLSLDIKQNISCNTSNKTTNKNSDGILFADADGGIPFKTPDNGGIPYIYRWEKKNSSGTWTHISGENKAELHSRTAGEYRVFVTDAKGVSYGATSADTNRKVAVSKTLVEPSPIVIGSTIKHINCYGQTNGEISLQLSGGTLKSGDSYKVRWNDNGSSAIKRTSLDEGDYTVRVTDSNGCVSTKTIEIKAPPSKLEVRYALDFKNPTSSSSNDGYIEARVKGGLKPTTANNYTFSWRNAKNQEFKTNVIRIRYDAVSREQVFRLNNVPEGIYTLTVIDRDTSTSQQCSVITRSKEISGTPPVDIFLIKDQDISCNSDRPSGAPSNDGVIMAKPSGGLPPYRYLWRKRNPTTNTWQVISGKTEQYARNLDYGSYQATIFDANNTSKTSPTLTLIQPPKLNVVLDGGDISCYLGSNGYLEATVSGGTPPYSIEWSTRQKTTNTSKSVHRIENLKEGIYSVTITDNKGCTTQKSLRVNQPNSPLKVTYTGHKNPTFVGASNGSIRAEISGGTPLDTKTKKYNYVWFDASNTPISSSKILSPVISGKQILILIDVPDGKYTLQVSDENASKVSNKINCENISDYTLEDTPELKLKIEQTNEVSCNSRNTTGGKFKDGALRAKAEGGKKPYTYIWKKRDNSGKWNTIPGKTTDRLVNQSPGFYAANVIDANNVTIGTYINDILDEPKDVIFEIKDPILLEVNVTPTHVLCNRGKDGTAKVTITGGKGPFDYKWKNKGLTTTTLQDIKGYKNRTINFSKLLPGTYQIEIRDDNGCFVSDEVKITAPDEIKFTKGEPKDPSYHNATNGSISVELSGGTGTYSYQWLNSKGVLSQATTTPVAGKYSISTSNLAHGTYTLVIKDAHFSKSGGQGGCTIQKDFVLNNPDPIKLSVVKESDISCNAKNASATSSANGALRAIASGGVGTLQYTWSKKNETTGKWEVLPTQTKAIAAGLDEGEYAVNVTDQNNIVYGVYRNNKFVTATPVIQALKAPTALDINILQKVDVFCYNSNDGYININVIGGIPPYDVVWSTGKKESVANASVQSSIKTLKTGDYTVTITDKNKCRIQRTINIAQPKERLAINTQISRDPSYHNATDGEIVVLISGGTQNAAKGYTYKWFDKNGVLAKQGTATPEGTAYKVSLDGLATGQYRIEVQDANYNKTSSKTSCAIQRSFDLKNPDPLTLSVRETKAISCHQNDASATLFANGQLTADADGGIKITTPGSLPYIYTWSKKNETTGKWEVLPSQTTAIASGLSHGEYAVNIKDANGIVYGTYSNNKIVKPTPVTRLLQQPEPLKLNLSHRDVFCFGGSSGFVKTTVSGGTPPYTVKWSTAKTQTLANTTELAEITNLIAGEYTIEVTDEFGCSFNDRIKITQPLNPLTIASQSSTDPTFFNATNGIVEATITGGTSASGAYNYRLLDQSSTEMLGGKTDIKTASFDIRFDNLRSGRYTLIVEDEHYNDSTTNSGCQASTIFKLENPDPITLKVAQTEDISCHQNNTYSDPWSDGELTATAQGGVPISKTGSLPYIYTWSKKNETTGKWEVLPSQTTAVASGLSHGEYAVNIEDANGIVFGIYEDNALKTATPAILKIEQPELLEVTIDKQNVFCNGGNDGYIKAQISGGIPPYKINWSTGKTEETSNTITQIQKLIKGDYTLTIVDDRGCNLEQIITITEPLQSLTIANSKAKDPLYYNATNGSITATINGGTKLDDKTYNYRWLDRTGSLLSKQGTAEVNGDNFEITLDNIGHGIYTLVVDDVNYKDANAKRGCITQQSFELKNPDPITLKVEQTQVISCNQNNTYSDPWSDGELTATADGGIKITSTGSLPYKYTWSKKNETSGLWEELPTQTTAVASGLSAGHYALNIEDANGIIFGTYENNTLKQATPVLFHLQEPELLQVAFTKQDVFCNNGSDGYVKADISGGIPPYKITWSTGKTEEITTTQSQINSLPKGKYSIDIIDARGCQTREEIQINEPLTPISLTFSDYGRVTSFGNNDGFIQATINGGTKLTGDAYHFEWVNSSGTSLIDKVTPTITSDGSYTLRLEQVPADTYYLTVTDANYTDATTKEGCGVIKKEFTLYDPIVIDISVLKEITCHNTNPEKQPFADAVLKAEVKGGAPFTTGEPYTYVWKRKNNAGLFEILTTQDKVLATDLGQGEYALNVVDRLGNVAGTYDADILLNAIDAYQTLVEPPLLQITKMDFTKVSCDPGNDATATATVIGGIPPYDIIWNNTDGDTELTAKNLTPGDYTVTIKDTRGCMVEGMVTIPPRDNTKQVELEHIDVTCKGYGDGRVTVQIIDGQGPYTFGWRHAGTALKTQNLSAGVYSSNITHQNKNTPFNTPEDGYEKIKDLDDNTATIQLINLIPGIYEITAVDANNCKIGGTYEIAPKDNPLEVVITKNTKQPSAPNFTDTFIEARVSGGNPNLNNYKYKWIRTNDGIDVTSKVTPSYDTATNELILLLQGVGQGIYDLEVNDYPTLPSINPDGCFANASFELKDPPPLELKIEQTAFISCNHKNTYGNTSDNAQLTAIAKGGVPFTAGQAYKYVWKRKTAPNTWEILTTETTNTLSNLPIGEYAVNIEDANGIVYGTYANNTLQKTTDVSFTVTEPELLELSFEKQDAYCNDGSDGWIKAILKGGTPPYTYTWSNGSETIATTNTTDIITNLPIGKYEVDIQDSLGCQVDGSYRIEQPTPLTIDYIDFDRPTAYGTTDGFIKVKVDGGTAPYTYQWKSSTGQVLNTQTVSNVNLDDSLEIQLNNIGADTYSLTVWDANFSTATTKQGCTFIDSEFTIYQPIAATIEVSKVISCNQTNLYGDAYSDGRLKVNVKGGVPFTTGNPYIYTWKKKNNAGIWETLIGQHAQEATNLDAGQYAVNVEDSRGTVIGNYDADILQLATDITYTFKEPELLELSFEKQDAYCNDGSDGWLKAIVKGGTPPYTYKWNTGKETIAVTDTEDIITNLPKGFYEVDIQDSLGCQVSGSCRIEQPTPLTVDYLDFDRPTAYGTSDAFIKVKVDGGTAPYTYQWKSSTGKVLNTQTVTNINPDTSLEIQLNNIGADTYFLTVWDANFNTATTKQGCTFIDSEFTIYEPIAAQIEVSKVISCNQTNVYGDPFSDGRLKVNVKGGVPFGSGSPYIYTWKKKNNAGIWEILTGQHTHHAINLDAGEYAVNVEDSRGTIVGNYKADVLQIATDITYTFKEPELLSVSLSKRDVYCNFGDDAWVKAIITGGTPPYKVQWSNGAEIKQTTSLTHQIDGLDRGNYSVIVTDSLGCNVIEDIDINEPTPINITYSDFARPSAYGKHDAYIEVTLSGATPFADNSYRYKWMNSSNTLLNNQTETSFSPSGDFIIRLKDIPADTYSLTIEDGHYDIAIAKEGCTYIDSEFTLYEPLTATVSIRKEISCNQENEHLNPYSDGALQVAVKGGVPFSSGQPYDVVWKKKNPKTKIWELLPTQNTFVAANLSAGEYAFNASDMRNTVIGDYRQDRLLQANDVLFTFNEPELLEVTIANTEVDCSKGDDATATAIISGGIPPYKIQWSTGETTPKIENLTPGKYIAEVEDARGCLAINTVTIKSPKGMRIKVITQEDPDCFNGNNGIIEVEAKGGVPPYTYQWSNGILGPKLSGLPTGTYSVTITDSNLENNRCAFVETFELGNPSEVDIDLGPDRTLCSGQTLDLDITIDDKKATYLWESANGFTSTDPQVSLDKEGLYKASVTNSLGCSVSDSIKIKFREQAISSEFLIATTAKTNTEIALVNVSSPRPEKIDWDIPEGVEIMTKDDDLVTLMFKEAGNYTIGMRAHQGDCYADYSKQIFVEEGQVSAAELLEEGDFIKEVVVFPNPSNGVFKVKIDLKREAAASLRMMSLINGDIIDEIVTTPKEQHLVDYDVRLSAGTYILIVETKFGNAIRKIIIK